MYAIAADSKRLWLLPLAVAVLPLLATHVALLISINAGHVPACVPYWEGCTSISRAARQGWANVVFQSVMLPCAVLHLLNWWQTGNWLRRVGAAPVGYALLACGWIAAVALAVYTAALGSEGELYRWMRRFGINFYFAGTFIAQLLLLRSLRQVGPWRGWHTALMQTIAVLILCMGLLTLGIREWVDQRELRDRLENVLEWNLCLLMTIWFLVQAHLLRLHRTGVGFGPVR